MKKLALLLLFASLSINSFAQYYMASSCEISFFSETPMENIEAVNTAAKPILNIATNDIQVKISIAAFVFKKPLMEEHFNENYMETDKKGAKDDKGNDTYPNKYAIFKGKIDDKIDFTKDGEYKVTVTGKLDMHGVVKDRTLEGKIVIKDGKINLESKFNIHIADHNIKVPSLYVKNIAEDVAVSVKATLEPFKK